MTGTSPASSRVSLDQSPVPNTATERSEISSRSTSARPATRSLKISSRHSFGYLASASSAPNSGESDELDDSDSADELLSSPAHPPHPQPHPHPHPHLQPQPQPQPICPSAPQPIPNGPSSAANSAAGHQLLTNPSLASLFNPFSLSSPNQHSIHPPLPDPPLHHFAPPYSPPALNSHSSACPPSPGPTPARPSPPATLLGPLPHPPSAHPPLVEPHPARYPTSLFALRSSRWPAALSPLNLIISPGPAHQLAPEHDLRTRSSSPLTLRHPRKPWPLPLRHRPAPAKSDSHPTLSALPPERSPTPTPHTPSHSRSRRSASTKRLSSFPAHPYALAKRAVVGETILVVVGLALALYRLGEAGTVAGRPLPLGPAYALAGLLVVVSSWRHRREARRGAPIAFRVPFTDARGYRGATEADDGFAVALGLPLIVAAAVLVSALRDPVPPAAPHLVELWAASARRGESAFTPADLFSRLCEARADLLCVTLLNLGSLLLDIGLAAGAGACGLLPADNGTRLVGAGAKSLVVASVLGALLRAGALGAAMRASIGLGECVCSVFAFQSCLYLASRLARRAFTLGEASIFASTGVALMLEILRLTAARLRYSSALHGHAADRRMLVPALFRPPTPAVAIQHVLVAGIFLIGFALAPLLLWSRELGQRPTKRSRPSAPRILSARAPPAPAWPLETGPYYRRFANPDAGQDSREHESASKGRMRKILAGLVYGSMLAIGLVVLSQWLGWLVVVGRGAGPETRRGWARVLGPGWVWFFGYCFWDEQGVDWTRLGLVGYWIVCMGIGIGGWTTYLVRKRRRRRGGWKRAKQASVVGSLLSAGASGAAAGEEDEGRTTAPAPGGPGEGERKVKKELNLRRKFFHGLACLMFIPALSIDVEFSSVSFTVGFVGFTFGEFARYFALYPIGAGIHVFFNEFIDSKDSGPVILSHFYLLTSCGLGVWLDGGRGVGRKIEDFVGVLVVGVGDSLASIVGRRWGRWRWSGSNKTREGTLVFVGSVVGSALMLKTAGLVQPFSVIKFVIGASLTGGLEACTNQNDNVVIPLYSWAIMKLLGV